MDSTGKLINQQPAYDQNITAEVQLQLGEEMVTGKVTQITLGPDGQVTGTYDNNLYLNSIIYDVEFPDDQVKEYAANIIAENMLTQVDSDDISTTLMETIVDHQRDERTSMSKPRMGGIISGRPQKAGNCSSSGRTSLNPGSNWLT